MSEWRDPDSCGHMTEAHHLAYLSSIPTTTRESADMPHIHVSVAATITYEMDEYDGQYKIVDAAAMPEAIGRLHTQPDAQRFYGEIRDTIERAMASGEWMQLLKG